MSGPLAGIRVLDLTTVIMGPFATQTLADFGASVIKIEPPEGDIMRAVVPTRHPNMGAVFQQLNRGKRDAVIDLKSEAGRDTILRLAAKSDVVISNIRPGALRRLRLDYDAMAAVNAAIVMVGCYGFSERGPYAGRAAYDDLIQALVGVPDLMARSSESGEARYVPLNFCDRVNGLAVTNAVLAALVQRGRDGRGQFVELPMFETMAHLLFGDHMGAATYPGMEGPLGYMRLLTHYRRPHKTADGYLCLLVYSDRDWRKFTALASCESWLDDPRFQTQAMRSQHIEHVYGVLDAEMASRTTDEWLALLEDSDLPHGRVGSLETLLDDEHLNAVGLFQTLEHPTQGAVRVTRNPTRFGAHENESVSLTAAPTYGEHTRAILREAGLDDAAIDAMFASGAAR